MYVIYMDTCVRFCKFMYIYIYINRDREKDTQTDIYNCGEPGSAMWLATRQFHSPCCQAEKSQRDINYTVTIEYLINCQILDLISYGITEQDRRWNADKPSALDPYIPTWLTTSPANHRPANFFFFFFFYIQRKLWKVVQPQVQLMSINFKFQVPILWLFQVQIIINIIY